MYEVSDVVARVCMGTEWKSHQYDPVYDVRRHQEERDGCLAHVLLMCDIRSLGMMSILLET